MVFKRSRIGSLSSTIKTLQGGLLIRISNRNHSLITCQGPTTTLKYNYDIFLIFGDKLMIYQSNVAKPTEYSAYHRSDLLLPPSPALE